MIFRGSFVSSFVCWGCADDKNESPGRIPTWKLLSNLKKAGWWTQLQWVNSWDPKDPWPINPWHVLILKTVSFAGNNVYKYQQHFDRELYQMFCPLVFVAGPRRCGLHDQSLALLGTTPLQELRLRIDRAVDEKQRVCNCGKVGNSSVGRKIR